MIKRFVYVTFQEEFIHQYPDAPEAVSYLRNPHRHLAHIKVQVEVFHNDREIEFILLKHELQKFWKSAIIEASESISCEMIADKLLSYMHGHYGTARDIKITVSEDNENGCELIFKKGE